MSLSIEKYNRKPFTVEAVQITVDNMAEVAEWCGGEVILEQHKNGRLVQYIKVDVNKPISERQTKAYVGDWILKGRGGFKCYSKKAFPACFEKAGPVVKQSDLEMQPDPMREVYEANYNAAKGQNLWPQEELFPAAQ